MKFQLKTCAGVYTVTDCYFHESDGAICYTLDAETFEVQVTQKELEEHYEPVLAKYVICRNDLRLTVSGIVPTFDNHTQASLFKRLLAIGLSYDESRLEVKEL